MKTVRSLPDLVFLKIMLPPLRFILRHVNPADRYAPGDFFVMAENKMDRKTEYLEREVWILAWNASVQHAALYKNGAWQNQRDQIDVFKSKIIGHMNTNVIPQYKVAVGEQQHCKNIRGLINYANAIDTGLLGENGYKYGVAQKVLNLSLKYHWCLGQIEEPPHCPIDKIIIDKTIYRGKVNWTQMLTETEYLKVISAVRSLANREKCSIALWELNNYERREP